MRLLSVLLLLVVIVSMAGYAGAQPIPMLPPPFPTEVATTALILSGGDRFIIFSTLSIASIVGGYLGYSIGYEGNSVLRRLFYYNPENTSKKGRELFKRYGWVAILLSSWIPVIGDIIPMPIGLWRAYTIKINP